MEVLQKDGGLSLVFVADKFLRFGHDGVSTFQGTKTSVTTQTNTNNAPFSIGVPCMAHKCNITFKTLFSLG
jgi:hypothetical protein